jgi:hypothetical protein
VATENAVRHAIRERLGFVPALSDMTPSSAPPLHPSGSSTGYNLIANPQRDLDARDPGGGVSLRAGLIGVALDVSTVAATLHARDGLNCLLIGADQFAAPQSGLYSTAAGAAATIRIDIITSLTGRN